MIGMFFDCSSLTSLNLANFNTNNINNMSYIFSNFNTNNAKYMSFMIYDLNKKCKIETNDNRI